MNLSTFISYLLPVAVITAGTASPLPVVYVVRSVAIPYSQVSLDIDVYLFIFAALAVSTVMAVISSNKHQ